MENEILIAENVEIDMETLYKATVTRVSPYQGRIARWDVVEAVIHQERYP